MSLQTATLGFGVASKNNNLYINLPYVGTIYIGMDISELNNNIAKYSQMALSLRHDEKNYRRTCYVDINENEVFSVMYIGNAIHRIRYQGLINLIPIDKIYQVGKKRFMTNIRVDRHMIYFKDNNEIFLKEIDYNSIQAVDLDSKSLGVVKRALTKETAERNSKAWMNVFDTKNRYAQEIYKKSTSEVEQLKQEYNEVSHKRNVLESKKKKIVDMIDKRKTLDSLNKKKQDNERELSVCEVAYKNIVNNNKHLIDKLIRAGKLYKHDGFLRLNENSDNTRKIQRTKQIPIYRTIERSYEPEMLLHEDYDQYIDRCKRERTSHSERVFSHYEEETYSEVIKDEEFKAAKDLMAYVNPAIEKCKNAQRVLETTQRSVAEAERKLSAYMQTPEYKQGLSEIDKIDKELVQVTNKLNTLRKQLYG